MKRLLACLACLFLLAAPAYAQKTKAALTTEINTNWPDNTTGAITPALLRSTVIDIVNSYYDLNGLSSANCSTHQWVASTPTLSSLGCSQPAFTDISGTAAVNQGGTGQTIASSAFQTLAPAATASGSLIMWNGVAWVQFAGNTSSNALVLQEDSHGVGSWIAASGSGTVTSATIASTSGIVVSGACTITTAGTCTVGTGPGVDANILNTQVANYSIANTDCGKTILAGTGASGAFTVTLPSISGFKDNCSITIKNGDTAAIKILSGFPSDVNTSLSPLQSLGVKIVNGAWYSFYNYPQFRSGTWTPTIAAAVQGDLNVVYSSRVGTWVRIGNVVFLNCDVVTSTFTHTTSTGQLSVGTMPFSSNEQYNADVSYNGINKAGGYSVVNAATSTGGIGIDFETSGMGLTIAVVNITDMPSGGTVLIRFSMWYVTDDP